MRDECLWDPLLLVKRIKFLSQENTEIMWEREYVTLSLQHASWVCHNRSHGLLVNHGLLKPFISSIRDWLLHLGISNRGSTESAFVLPWIINTLQFLLFKYWWKKAIICNYIKKKPNYKEFSFELVFKVMTSELLLWLWEELPPWPWASGTWWDPALC